MDTAADAVVASLAMPGRTAWLSPGPDLPEGEPLRAPASWTADPALAPAGSVARPPGPEDVDQVEGIARHEPLVAFLRPQTVDAAPPAGTGLVVVEGEHPALLEAARRWALPTLTLLKSG